MTGRLLLSGYSPDLTQQTPSAATIRICADGDSEWGITLRDPTFAAVAENGRILFVCSEGEEGQPAQSGVLYALRQDSDSARAKAVCWKIQDQIATGCGKFCHVSCRMDASGQIVYASSYETGKFCAIRYQNGSFVRDSLSVSQIPLLGNGPLRAHCAVPFSVFGEKLLCVCAIDSDAVHFYKSYDTVNANAEDCGTPYSSLMFHPHTGPRHFLHAPDERFAYLITEYSNEIYPIIFSKREPPRCCPGISTLPPGWQGESYGASLAISRNGKRLYASNRGHNSITLCIVEKERVTPVGYFSCGGDWPRHIALSLDETLLYVANQRSHSVSVLPVSENGELGAPIRQIPFYEPAFVLEY